jgi:ketosteroid isomerase-like protein
MTGRTAIATVIEDAYAARCRGDLDGLLKHLHPACSYRMIGAPQAEPMCTETCGRDNVRGQMAQLIQHFVFTDVEPLSLTVEGDRAVYRWRTKVTFTPNGRSEVMDVMDLIELEDGQIRSVEEFTDTAGVMRLTAS